MNAAAKSLPCVKGGSTESVMEGLYRRAFLLQIQQRRSIKSPTCFRGSPLGVAKPSPYMGAFLCSR